MGLLWLEVLNRGLAGAEGEAALGTEPGLLVDLQLLRRLAVGRLLGRPHAGHIEAAASQWLATVTLRVAGGRRWNGTPLPALVAARRSSRHPAAVEEILSTALVELLSGTTALSVARCRGVARGGPPSPYDPEDDAAFAALAGLERLRRAGWVQCPRLVVAPRGSQYCSKACSNASFAARKGDVEPRYFAAKQAAYRERQRRRQEEPRDVFAFVD